MLSCRIVELGSNLKLLGEASLKKTGNFGENSQRGVEKNRRKFPISIWRKILGNARKFSIMLEIFEFQKLLKYQPSGAGGTRSPPAKSKMAAMGP